MSDLEHQHAKPAMQELIRSDDPVKLPPQRIDSIVAFAFKTAVIGHAMDKGKSLFFPSHIFSPMSLRKFSQSLVIPRGIQLWVGCLSIADPRNGIFRMSYGKTPPRTPNGFKHYVCTFGIGRLVFQLLATQWTSGTNRRRLIPIVDQDSVWDTMAIRVWPHFGRTFDWPPRNQIPPHLVDIFCGRFKRFSINV
jgi:hypothetical protein